MGGRNLVLLGDMNFACDMSNAGNRECFKVLSKYNIYRCDNYMAEEKPCNTS